MTFIEEFKSNFYRKGTRHIDIRKIILVLFILPGLIAFLIYKEADLKEKAKERLQHLRYTIGITGDRHKNFRSSKPTVNYYFFYFREKHKGNHHVDADNEDNLISNGGRYYVQFSSKNPNNSKLLLDYPVPDSITIAPPDGWNYMPGYNR